MANTKKCTRCKATCPMKEFISSSSSKELVTCADCRGDGKAKKIKINKFFLVRGTIHNFKRVVE